MNIRSTKKTKTKAKIIIHLPVIEILAFFCCIQSAKNMFLCIFNRKCLFFVGFLFGMNFKQIPCIKLNSFYMTSFHSCILIDLLYISLCHLFFFSVNIVNFGFRLKSSSVCYLIWNISYMYLSKKKSAISNTIAVFVNVFMYNINVWINWSISLRNRFLCINIFHKCVLCRSKHCLQHILNNLFNFFLFIVVCFAYF